MSKRNQKVWFLKGLPASGKSTWARQKIEDDRMNGIVTKRVNKDELRAMMDNSNHSKERENFVNQIQSNIIYDSLVNGYDVIIDNTNFYPRHFERAKELVKAATLHNKNINVAIEVKFFDISLQECIERDRKRENSVGERVIKDMYNKYLKKENVPLVSHDPNLANCMIVDVDGTLAIRGNRSPYDYWKADKDKLNQPVADLIKSLQKINKDIDTIIVTGRENLYDENGSDIAELTQHWLDKNGVHYDEFYIRQNGDQRKDYIVKEEIYKSFIQGKYNVFYVFDDRKQVINMWRDQGLFVLDVAGNEF